MQLEPGLDQGSGQKSRAGWTDLGTALSQGSEVESRAGVKVREDEAQRRCRLCETYLAPTRSVAAQKIRGEQRATAGVDAPDAAEKRSDP